MPDKKDLSIIVTAHNEGLIAHKTMLSIFAATKELMVQNISYEIIISIDNGTLDTLAYFDRYNKTADINVLKVSFKDLSASRNNAIQSAIGTYTTFIDADDLMSKNWPITALETLRANPGSIVHPEYSITFGDDNLLWKKRNSTTIENDTLALIDNNLWDSPCFAETATLLSHPYHPNGNGFGYEDKHFNAQTLSAGITHLVAPATILFVRRKVSGSMLRQASTNLVTIAPSKLLSYDAIKGLDISPYTPALLPPSTTRSTLEQAKHFTKKSIAAVHHHAKKSDTYLRLIQPLREIRQAGVTKKLNDTYPKWMIAAWKEIHVIDNTTFPAKDLLKSLPWYNAENTLPGYKYAQLVKEFSRKPDTLFFVPHLIKGGADKVFINYATELNRLHEDWNIGVVQTEPKESIWMDKLPTNITFVHLFKIMEGLDYATQHRLLATFVTQNDIKRIIIGNSQLAYDFVSNYQSLILNLGITIYCFAFGEEFDDEGRLWGHIHTGIPRIYPVITRVITDNENTVNKLEKEYAFDRSKFRVHYQPTDVLVQSSVHNSHTKTRVLWASRVCKQKRPDILKSVSTQLGTENFIVDAYGELEEGLTKHYFDDSNVHYKGSFNGISSIPTNEYDIYLYTSEGDGIPNVLQEMTANGLPIVASNVGGIGEFVITNKTGILIKDHENISDYVQAISQLRDESLRIRLNQGAQTLLADQFSRKHWQNQVRKDIK